MEKSSRLKVVGQLVVTGMGWREEVAVVVVAERGREEEVAVVVVTAATLKDEEEVVLVVEVVPSTDASFVPSCSL